MMTVLGLHWAYLPASRGKTEQFHLEPNAFLNGLGERSVHRLNAL
jgi:hypothetical protein